jgi:hypothetical protein
MTVVAQFAGPAALTLLGAGVCGVSFDALCTMVVVVVVVVVLDRSGTVYMHLAKTLIWAQQLLLETLVRQLLTVLRVKT